MTPEKRLYLHHLEEQMTTMDSMDIDQYRTRDLQSINRLLRNKDRKTLLDIFLLSPSRENDSIVHDQEEWKKVQFYWKSIIVAASLQANVKRYTPLTMAQIFSLLYTIDEMTPSHHETGAHFLTEKMMELYASGIAEYEQIKNPHVAKAVQQINYRVKSPELNLQSVSRKLGISAPYLSAIFQQEMQETFVSYLHRKKIEASLEHLLHTNYPIQQIAEKYGYSSVTSYGRKFKEIKGTTPLQYRKKHSI